METERMRQEIIEAIEQNKCSKRSLMDVRAVNKIIEGTAKQSTIELAYSRLAEAKAKHQEKNPDKVRAARMKDEQKESEKTMIETEQIEQVTWAEKNCPNLLEQIKVEQCNKVEQQKETEIKQIGWFNNKDEQTKVEQGKDTNLEIIKRIEALELESKRLREENQGLKLQMELHHGRTKSEHKNRIKDEQGNNPDNKERVLGFSIRLENTWTEGKSYLKYYAIKRIAGKHYRIYLGGSPEQAEQKIKAYCAKHSLILSPVV